MDDSANLKYQSVPNCESPIKIRNKVTHEEIFVPCGKCKVCMLHKSSEYSQLCMYEEAEHLITYFVTLTYSNDCIPKMRVIENRAKDGSVISCTFVGATPRLDEDFNTPLSVVYGNYDYRSLLDKCQLFDISSSSPCLSYLSSKDLQNFLKRFRKHASKISHSPIRYFAVGEYGPKHFRCHWHLLLYIDDIAQASQISELLRKSWRFGRVDYSASRGQCNNYLSKYVNSFSSLPFVLTSKAVRPRNYHSVRFGIAYFERNKKEIYQKGLDYFKSKSVVFHGKPYDLRLFNRAKVMLFPRCVCYAAKNDIQRYEMYMFFARYRLLFPTAHGPAPANIFKLIYNGEPFDGYDGNSFQSSFVEFIRNELQFSLSSLRRPPDDMEQYVKSFIYRLFYVSKHFIEFCCDGDLKRSYNIYKCIDNFYKQVEQDSFLHWYLALEEFSDHYPNEPFDLYYNNPCSLYSDGLYNPETRNKNPVRRLVLYRKHVDFELSTKHKLQNDINGIFIRNNNL